MNGGFEDGSTNPAPPDIATAPLTGWNPTPFTGTDPNPPNGPIELTQVTGLDTTDIYGLAPKGGRIAAAFSSSPSTPANSLASISQDVSTVPTDLYKIEMWIANPFQDQNARANLFSIQWGATFIDLSLADPVHFAAPTGAPNELAGDPGTYVVAPGNPWFLLTIDNLPASAGPTTTLKISGQNNNYATLVDDVVVTPEPSSIVLLLAGGALIGARRRRNRLEA